MSWYHSLLVGFLVLVACGPEAVEVRIRDAPLPDSPGERAAYALGWRMAEGYRQEGLVFDPLRFVSAFRVALDGGAPVLGEQEEMVLQSIAHRQARRDDWPIPADPPPERLDLAASTTITTQGQAIAQAFAQVDARPLQALRLTIDAHGFTAGFLHAWWKRPALLEEPRRQQSLQEFDRAVAATKQAQNAEATETGRRFLADYAQRPAVTRLPSGVCYRLLIRGSEPALDGNDQARLRFTARRVDGSIYERSGQDGDGPADLAVPGLLAGLRDAVLAVPVGSRIEAVLPSEMAQGDAWEPALPGGSVLIYDLAIEAAERKPGTVP